MPCDSRPFRPQQTLQERIAEVRSILGILEKKITKRQITPVVGKNGAITFKGLSDEERGGITDACIYRRIMATGSQLAKLEIERAQRAAGVTVNKQVVAQGIHSHDGGRSWHPKG